MQAQGFCYIEYGKMSRDRISRFKRDLNKCGVVDGELLIAACSGGADSMLLLHALKVAGSAFEVAHVNFELRGEESDGDEESVKVWCKDNSIIFHSAHLSAKSEAEKSGNGIQDAARKLRYDYFEELKNQRDAHAIAVAHHENDQAETLIHHLLRSANPSSLGCMSHRSADIIRPFLNWKRDEIEQWLSDDKVSFREDSSNTDSKYTRNRIRHEVLPLLNDIRQGTSTHLAEWAKRLRTQANAVEGAMSEASRDIISYSEHSSSDGEIYRLDIQLLGSSLWGTQILDRMLAERGWPIGSREEARLLMRSSVGAHVTFGGDLLNREREHLVLSISENSPQDIGLTTEILEDLAGIELPNDPGVLWVGNSSLQSPHVWRKWEHGDRISPTGMEGTVNVSDLLTQWKVPHSTRSSAHVLLDSTSRVSFYPVFPERYK
jgi:tRNA(Ile)-lysidine synthase